MKKNIIFFLFLAILTPILASAVSSDKVTQSLINFDAKKNQYYVLGAYGDCNARFYSSSQDKLKSLLGTEYVKSSCAKSSEELVDISQMEFPMPGFDNIDFASLGFSTFEQARQQDNQLFSSGNNAPISEEVLSAPRSRLDKDGLTFYIDTEKPFHNVQDLGVYFAAKIKTQKPDKFSVSMNCWVNPEGGYKKNYSLESNLAVSSESKIVGRWIYYTGMIDSFGSNDLCCVISATNSKGQKAQSPKMCLTKIALPKVVSIAKIAENQATINALFWSLSPETPYVPNLYYLKNGSSEFKEIKLKESQKGFFETSYLLKNLESCKEYCVFVGSNLVSDPLRNNDSVLHCFKTAGCKNYPPLSSLCTNAIRETPKMTLARAVAIAKKIASKVVIRPEFLLGISAQETKMGRDLGKHTMKTCASSEPGNHNAYTGICDKLSIPSAECYKMPCSYACAFGIVQFIPVTWFEKMPDYGEKTREIFGVSEKPGSSWWNTCASYTGSALKLSALGASKKTEYWEDVAACKYNLGSATSYETCDYSRETRPRVKCFEQYIANNGKVSQGCKILFFGSFGE